MARSRGWVPSCGTRCAALAHRPMQWCWRNHHVMVRNARGALLASPALMTCTSPARQHLLGLLLSNVAFVTHPGLCDVLHSCCTMVLPVARGAGATESQVALVAAVRLLVAASAAAHRAMVTCRPCRPLCDSASWSPALLSCTATCTLPPGAQVLFVLSLLFGRPLTAGARPQRIPWRIILSMGPPCAHGRMRACCWHNCCTLLAIAARIRAGSLWPRAWRAVSACISQVTELLPTTAQTLSTPLRLGAWRWQSG